MPEEGLETAEIRESMEEHRHHAHGGRGHDAGPSWIMTLSLSTALIAALAAVASLYSGSLANEAIVLKNDAVLEQSKASDKWSEYQAKRIKGHLFATQAELMTPEKAADFKAKSEKEMNEAKPLMAEARAFEASVASQNAMSTHALHLHHLFARSVTIFQVAIALAAIAALTKKKPLWYVSMVAGAVGIFFAGQGFLPEQPHSGGGEHHGGPPSSASGPSPGPAEHH